MGDFNSIRFKIRVKPEFIALANEMIFEHSIPESSDELLRDFSAAHEEAHILLNGTGLKFVPNEWEEAESFETRSLLNRSQPVWGGQFSVSLRSEPILVPFVDEILSEISEEFIHMEIYHEQSETSDCYSLVDGKAVVTQRKTFKDGNFVGYLKIKSLPEPLKELTLFGRDSTIPAKEIRGPLKDNSGIITVTSVEEMQGPKFDKLHSIALTIGKRYLFLGQAFAYSTYYDIKTKEVVRYTYPILKSAPYEVLAYLAFEGKLDKRELAYPALPEDMDGEINSWDYRELFKQLNGQELHMNFSQYYGKGEKGRSPTKEQEEYILETYGFSFKK
jgi:hypothetical protein